MAFQDYFGTPIAYDPTQDRLVADATFTVHAIDDTSLSTPLPVTEPGSGAAIAELRSSSIGVLPDFRVAGDPAQVLIKSGSFVTSLTSVFGAVLAAGLDPDTVAAAILASDEASAARDDAQQAAASLTPEMISEAAGEALGDHPDVIASAVGLAQSDAGLVRKGQPEAVRVAALPGISFAVMTESADGLSLGLGAFILDEAGEIHPDSAAKIAAAVGATKPVTSIAVLGDSMSSDGKIPSTAGSYVRTMAQALGLEMFNPAIPGENPLDGLFRTGIPIRVTGLTSIPADTTEFVLAASQVNGGETGHRDTTATDGTGISTGAGVGQFLMDVMGVPMRFRRVVNTEGGYTVGQWRVNRVTAGQAIPLAPGVDVYATYTGAARFKDALWVFASGRNDMNLTRIRSVYDRVVAWIGHDNYLVLPPVLTSAAEVDGSFGTGRATVNGLLAAYAGRAFDWQPSMSSTAALTMAGITPTSQDTSDISDGIVPYSLRADTTHFTSLGVQVWGQTVLDLAGSWLNSHGIH
ncbi:hypothetical protein ACUOFU_16790 [Microbacterium arabinogalactanolyticum]|uniref:hypothetical protein n=1 Tax=Microbacterium arabinogalactanolyticum TaxID=69365 RepID=UPI004044B557